MYVQKLSELPPDLTHSADVLKSCRFVEADAGVIAAGDSGQNGVQAAALPFRQPP